MSADGHDKDDMAEEYDFSEAKQGPILASRPHATTIWLRVDSDLLDWYRAQVQAQGGRLRRDYARGPTALPGVCREHSSLQGKSQSSGIEAERQGRGGDGSPCEAGRSNILSHFMWPHACFNRITAGQAHIGRSASQERTSMAAG
jgi:hypothetical protein